MQQWLYNLVGPTTKHLELEVALVVCMELITMSSMQALYKKDALTNWQDWTFVFLHTLWLSKYLLLRIVCIWDPTTHVNPTMRGLLTNFITTHVTGGQIHDRPPPKQLAKEAGFSTAREETLFANCVPNTLHYGLQLWKIYVWLPLLRFMQSLPSPSTSFSSDGRTTDRQRNVATVMSLFPWVYASSPFSTGSSGRRQGSLSTIYNTLVKWSSLIWSHGATLQFLLPNVVSYMILYPIVNKLRYPGESALAPSTLYNAGFSSHMNTEEGRIKRSGMYTPVDFTKQQDLNLNNLPDLFMVLMGISFLVMCVSFFSRILPPIPDQIAGHNVAYDFRQDAKLNHSHHHHYHGSKKAQGKGGAKSKSGETQNTVWTERNNPIRTENRVRVNRMVYFWRLLDLWLSVGWLPRSDYLARALGHAFSQQHLPHRMAQDLYPVGIVQPHRPDTLFRSWEKQIQENTSLVWHFWNVMALPVFILGIQMFYLNRTYVSISTYFANEWALVGPADGDVPVVASTSNLSSWDGRKKYKKGDLVIYNKYLYQAAHDEPEGRPVDPDIRDLQDPTLYELGHVGTSEVIRKILSLQVGITLIFMAIWLSCFFLLDRTPDGLLLAVVCHIVASFALSSVGTTNYSELNQINNAICGRPTNWTRSRTDALETIASTEQQYVLSTSSDKSGKRE